MSDQVVIMRAASADLATVVDLLAAAARQLVAGDVHQWPVPYPADEVAEAIARGEVCVARQGDLLIGTISIKWSQSGLWFDQPGDAGYFRRLAIHPNHWRMGLGSLMLAAAEAVVRENGLPLARLDCWAGNVKLNTYFSALGYQHRGDVTVMADRGSYQVSRYQKDLTR